MTEANKPNADWEKLLQGIDFNLPPAGNKPKDEIIQPPNAPLYQWELIPEDWRKRWQIKAAESGDLFLYEDLLKCYLTGVDIRLLNLLFKLSEKELFLRNDKFNIIRSTSKVIGVKTGYVPTIRSADGLSTYGLIVISRHPGLKMNLYNEGVKSLVVQTNEHLKLIEKPLIPPFDPKF